MNRPGAKKVNKHLRGFTLLELLVAIGLFAVISAISYGTLVQILTHRDRLDVERDYWRGLSLAFLRIEDDLAYARERKVRDIDGFVLPAFIGQPTDTRAVSRPAVEFTRGGRLVLATGTQTSLQRVAYRLRDNTLVREAWPVLDRAPTTETQSAPLLQNVENFSIRFYTADDKWKNQWPDSDKPDILPRGVEVTIKLDDDREYIRVFVIK